LGDYYKKDLFLRRLLLLVILTALLCSSCASNTNSGSESELPIASSGSTTEEETTLNALEEEYLRAVALYESGKYEEAKEAFESLKGEYKYSARYIEECERAIQEAIYKAAITLMEQKEYEAALEGFRKLPEGYDGLEEKIKECKEEIEKQEKYTDAVKLYESQDFDAAYLLFDELGNYENSDKYAVEIKKCQLRDAKTLDEVTFGKRNGKSITWIVLLIEHDKILLWEKDADSFGKLSENWENSDLRKNLERFYLNSFSDAEKELIISVPIIQDNSPSRIYSQQELGNDTLDKMFILSYSEAKMFLTEDLWRFGNQWIRTPALEMNDYCVFSDGYLAQSRWCKRINAHSAIWLDLSESETAEIGIVGDKWTAKGRELTEKAVGSILRTQQAKYWEGHYWGFESEYQLDSVSYGNSGYTYYYMPMTACTGFAFLMQDAAFSGMEVHAINEKAFIERNSIGEWKQVPHSMSFDWLKVGDIIGYENFDKDETSHAVVVLEKNNDYVTLVEGNYNQTVHWGRRYSREEFDESAFEIKTRWPVLTQPANITCKDGEQVYFGSTSTSQADSSLWIVSTDNGKTWAEVQYSETVWNTGSALVFTAHKEYDGYLFRRVYSYPNGWYIMSDIASIKVEE